MASEQYWNNFYSGRLNESLQRPSPFAEYIQTVISDIGQLVDFGCGTGRDFRYLAKYARSGFGIDASSEAIAHCKRKDTTGDYVLGTARDLLENIKARFDRFLPVTLYSRFVLHAMTSDEQDELLDAISSSPLSNLTVAFEYRVEMDSCLKKTFGEHARYYINHDRLGRRLVASGFVPIIDTVGTGLAKFGDEDPVIGRLVSKKIK